MNSNRLRQHAQQMRVIIEQKISAVLRSTEGRGADSQELLLDRLCAWRDECSRLATYPRFRR